MFRWRFIIRYYRIIKLKAMSELYWITVLGNIGDISVVFAIIGGVLSISMWLDLSDLLPKEGGAG